MDEQWREDFELRTDDGEGLLESISTNVAGAVKQFEPQVIHPGSVMNLVVNVATSLQLITQQPIADQPWLAEAIIARMNKAEAAWRKHEQEPTWTSGSFGGSSC